MNFALTVYVCDLLRELTLVREEEEGRGKHYEKGSKTVEKRSQNKLKLSERNRSCFRFPVPNDFFQRALVVLPLGRGCQEDRGARAD